MSATAQKPTIVLIPGAWHLPSPTFDSLIAILTKSGYPTLPITLPSVGSPAIFADDVATIRTSITAIIEEQARDVVVLMHSYGAAPGTKALNGLAKTVREKEGKKGGVIGLVYVAAMIPMVGESVHEFRTAVRNQETDLASGIRPVNPSAAIMHENGTFSVKEREDQFYNDLDDEVAMELAKSLKSHSLAVFNTKLTYAAYDDIPAVYLVCLKDRAVSYKSQQRMA
ncbi:unnamed protein product [Calypogeia fissa]